MKNLITPVYQPIFDMTTGAVAWVEVLARIANNHSGSCHGELLRLGEQYGFIHEIDHTILSYVAEALMELCVPVAINVSTKTIEDHGRCVVAFLQERPGLASRLVWEITETCPPRDVSNLASFASTVKRLGSKIAVDDFGQGFWDEHVVSAICPDVIKTLWCSDGMHEALRLSRKFKAVAVVECVETLEMLDLLRPLPVRYVQGFGLSRPLTLDLLLSSLPHLRLPCAIAA